MCVYLYSGCFILKETYYAHFQVHISQCVYNYRFSASVFSYCPVVRHLCSTCVWKCFFFKLLVNVVHGKIQTSLSSWSYQRSVLENPQTIQLFSSRCRDTPVTYPSKIKLIHRCGLLCWFMQTTEQLSCQALHSLVSVASLDLSSFPLTDVEMLWSFDTVSSESCPTCLYCSHLYKTTADGEVGGTFT